ncbi:MAG TPA: ABC transporter permease [Vicinamibacterales bacterium]|nr:ABC transporter permease [Vicinamibacterales bacterium]
MKTPFALFVARRLAAGLAFVLLVSIAAFILGRLAPGDAASTLVLSGVDAVSVADTRTRLGLDRPLLSHLGSWLAGLASFDLGHSSRYNQPVAGLVGTGLLHTAQLAALALLVATGLGLPLGVVTGSRPRGWAARLLTPVSAALLACPPIVATLALLLVAVRTDGVWLSVEPGHLAVPVLALALPLSAGLERLQARATGDALSAPSLAAAVARGIPRRRVIWVHAVRQSLRPVLGVYGIVIGSLFSGSLAVEVITSWPGIGRLTYDALIARDLHLLVGCVLAGSVLITVGNVMADLLRAAADPRVRDT